MVWLQVSYSLLWRAVEYGIAPFCRDQGIALLAYSPLQQGLLSGRFRKLQDVPEGRRRTRLFNSTRSGHRTGSLGRLHQVRTPGQGWVHQVTPGSTRSGQGSPGYPRVHQVRVDQTLGLFVNEKGRLLQTELYSSVYSF